MTTNEGEDRAKQGEAKEPGRPTCLKCKGSGALASGEKCYLCFPAWSLGMPANETTKQGEALRQVIHDILLGPPYRTFDVDERTDKIMAAVAESRAATTDFDPIAMAQRNNAAQIALKEMEGHAAYWKNLYLDLLEKQPIPPEYQKESRAATRAGEGEAGDETHRVNWIEWTKLQARVVDAEKERDHWRAKAEQPSACPTSICAAAKRDDVTCADDSCDIETGVRRPPAAGSMDQQIADAMSNQAVADDLARTMRTSMDCPVGCPIHGQQPPAAGADEVERVIKAADAVRACYEINHRSGPHQMPPGKAANAALEEYDIARKALAGGGGGK